VAAGDRLEWVIDSFIQTIRSNGWFIQEWDRCLWCLWICHWIFDSIDSFKMLNHSVG